MGLNSELSLKLRKGATNGNALVTLTGTEAIRAALALDTALEYMVVIDRLTALLASANPAESLAFTWDESARRFVFVFGNHARKHTRAYYFARDVRHLLTMIVKGEQDYV